MLKKIWHDPVWSKVIANAIWTIPSLGVISYIAGWWPPIVQWIYSESSISNRLLLISSVLALWKVIDIALLINSPFRELHKAMKKFDNKSTNTDAKTTAPTNTPVWKTYNTIKQPTYGTQALDQDRSKATEETNATSASQQAVDAEILGVLSKDGMRRTIVDLQRKTNRKDTVIVGSLKRLIVRGLIQIDAGDGTQLERYSIPKGQAEELQNRW